MPATASFDSHTLCSLVESYRCLYDPTIPEYTKKEELDKAWQEIGALLNENPNDCRTRWSNIRGTYSKYLSTRNSKKTSYYLESNLAFLQPYIKSRKSMVGLGCRVTEAGKFYAEERMKKRKSTEMNRDSSYSAGRVKEEVLTEEEEIGESDLEEEDFNESLSNGAPSQEGKENEARIKPDISPSAMQTQSVRPAPPLKRIKPMENTSWSSENYLTPAVVMGSLHSACSVSSAASIPEVILDTANISRSQAGTPPPSSPPPSCPEMLFLRSILPEFKRMTYDQKFKFRTSVLQTIGEILYQK